MSDTTFLTEDEVNELTGIRRGNGKKSFRELQVEWMQRHGYPARLNAAGRAIVARSAVERVSKPPESKQKEWTSNAWS